MSQDYPTKVLEFFQDETGAKSFGRVAAAYCIVIAVFAFVAGLWLPGSQAYCTEATKTFLYTAGAFYGFSKGQQAANPWIARAAGITTTTPNQEGV